MSEDRDNRDARRDGPAKRPYEAPRIVSEKIFETTALKCGKRSGGSGQCTTKAKVS